MCDGIGPKSEAKSSRGPPHGGPLLDLASPADAVKAVNDGTLAATVAQKPKEMGKISIETAKKVIAKETVPATIPFKKTASSFQGGIPMYSNQPQFTPKLKKLLTWLTLVLYLGQPGLSFAAEVVADPHAGKNRPVVDTAANGTSVVQITTPSAAGVSRNLYTHFNVNTNGLILNNSATLTQTQLAGYISGNPSIGNRPARIILNEVTGTNPSYLRGYTEVAGQCADVIIANQNGIYGNGFGFLNTSRAVLTTGTPVFGGSGSLDAFRVSRGQVSIEGQGLDASSIDRVDIISRATTVNAGIWAKELNVVTGANQVNYETLATRKIAGDGSQPQVALDVGLLGGMYANKIRLIGTEQGVGVNSQGILAAQNGNLIVTQEGKVILAGNTSATGHIQVQTNDTFTNQGTLYAQGNTQIDSAQAVTNTGLLAAGANLTINGPAIQSSGTIAAGLTADGSIGTTGDLTFTAAAVDLSGGKTYAGGNAKLTIQNTLDNTGAILQANGHLTIQAQQILNSHATLAAGQNLTLNTPGGLDNTQGLLYAGQNLTLNPASHLNNRQGQVGAGRDLVLQTQQLTNTAGLLAANHDLSLTANTLTGDGTLSSGRDIHLTLSSAYTHQTGAQISANQNLTLTTQGAFINQGTMEAAGTLNLDAASIQNQQDGLLNAGTLQLTAGTAITNQGRIDGGLIQTTSQTFTNTGTLFSDTLVIKADTIHNLGDQATIGTTGNASFFAGSLLENKDGATLYSQGNIIVAASDEQDANGLYTRPTGLILNQSATMEAEGSIGLFARQITNKKRQFEIQQREVSRTTRTETIPFKSPYYKAKRTYTETIVETVATKDSDPGQILAGGNIILRGSIENNVSTITAGGHLDFESDKLTNIGYTNTRIVTKTGTSYYTRRERYCKHRVAGHCVDHGHRDVTDKKPYYQQTKENIPGYPAVFSANQRITGQAVTIDNLTLGVDGAPVGGMASTVLGQTSGSAGSTNPSGYTFRVPANSLYTIRNDPDAQYLVETNPRFTDKREFLSSDYMLAKTATDPAKVQKRLGDGYYEQKLIRDQLTLLTGRQFLDNYTSSEEQYKALLDNGVAAARRFQLTLGIALTEDQIKALTSDIVWMVEQEIQGQKVLVPVVYLAGSSDMELKPDGALMAAKEIEITAAGDLTNSGSVKAGTLLLDVNNLTNRGGLLSGTDTLQITAAGDILNQSGQIAGGNVFLGAGGDINNETLVTTVNLQQPTPQPTKGLSALTGQRTNTNSTEYSTTLIHQTGSIEASGNLTLTAGRDIVMNGAQATAGQDLTVSAGRNLELTTVEHNEQYSVNSRKYTAEYDATHHITTNLQAGGSVSLIAQNDATLKGAQIDAGKDLTLAAGGNVTVTAVKDRVLDDSNKKGYDGNFRRDRTDDETVIGSTLAAGNNLTVAAVSQDPADLSRGKVEIAGSSLYTKTDAQGNPTGQGQIQILAMNDITVKEVNERHESLKESQTSSGNLFSSKTTYTRDQTLVNQAMGSTVSGEQVDILTDKDLTVRGSNVVATNDVNLKADNVRIESAQTTVESDHYRYTKKSGLSVSLSGGSLNVFAGTTKTKTTEDTASVQQEKSTIGSVNGKVNIEANKDVGIKASDIIAKTGIDITAQNVAIEAGNNTTDSHSTYEFKQSGVTLTVGNALAQKADQAVQSVERINQVDDHRLQALHGIKAVEAGDQIWQMGDDIRKETKAAQAQEQSKAKINGQNNANTPQNNTGTGTGTPNHNTQATQPEALKMSVSVSVGSTKQTSESTTHTSTAVGSTLQTDGNIAITATGSGQKDAAGKATDGNIRVGGSEIAGGNVKLDAAKDILLQSAQNTYDSSSQSKGSSSSVGTSLGAGGGLSVSHNASNGNSQETRTSHSETLVTATDTLTMKSGNDTNLTGAQAIGDTVKVEAGGNLNLISQQDTETYNEKNSSKGGTIGSGSMATNVGANKGKIDSDYKSVNKQTGIFAGDGGFDITVEKNTGLKGAVVASTAIEDKNKISTETITVSDIENKAEYKATSSGVNYANGAGVAKNDQGFKPVLSVPVSGEDSNNTKAAISQGTIEIRNEANRAAAQKAILDKLNRNPETAHKALNQIFDKKTVQEKQELSKMFGEEAFKQIHLLSQQQYNQAAVKAMQAKTLEEMDEQIRLMNAWSEGGEYKVALHAAAGAAMADLGGGNALSGGIGAGLNEAIQGELSKRFQDNPDLHQWASAIIGAAAAKVTGGNAQTGAATAASGTKNNHLYQSLRDKVIAWLKNKGLSDAEIEELIKKIDDIAQETNESVNDPEQRDYTADDALFIDQVKQQLAGKVLENGKTIDANLLNEFGDYYLQESRSNYEAVIDQDLVNKLKTQIGDFAVESYEQISDDTKRALVKTEAAALTLYVMTLETANGSSVVSQLNAAGVVISASGTLVLISGVLHVVYEDGLLVPTTIEQASRIFASSGSNGNSSNNSSSNSGNREPTNAESVNWKGFSDGKLKSHYEKHVVDGKEFGNITQNEYLKKAKEFATESNPNFQETKVGNFNIKYDPETRRVFIGHEKSREIRTFYRADSRDAAPFQAAIKLAKELSGK